MSLERFHWQTTQSDDEAAVRALYEQLMAGHSTMNNSLVELSIWAPAVA
jgi:hypothetical protein